jgi:hypothetical protein
MAVTKAKTTAVAKSTTAKSKTTLASKTTAKSKSTLATKTPAKAKTTKASKTTKATKPPAKSVVEKKENAKIITTDVSTNDISEGTIRRLTMLAVGGRMKSGAVAPSLSIHLTSEAISFLKQHYINIVQSIVKKATILKSDGGNKEGAGSILKLKDLVYVLEGMGQKLYATNENLDVEKDLKKIYKSSKQSYHGSWNYIVSAKQGVARVVKSTIVVGKLGKFKISEQFLHHLIYFVEHQLIALIRECTKYLVHSSIKTLQGELLSIVYGTATKNLLRYD